MRWAVARQPPRGRRRRPRLRFRMRSPSHRGAHAHPGGEEVGLQAASSQGGFYIFIYAKTDMIVGPVVVYFCIRYVCCACGCGHITSPMRTAVRGAVSLSPNFLSWHTARARALSISASRSASCTPHLHRPPYPLLAGSRSVRCHRAPAMPPSLSTALPSLAAAPPSLLLLAALLSLAAVSSPSPVVECR